MKTSFFLGLHRLLMEKQDSPFFSFFGLHQLLGDFGFLGDLTAACLFFGVVR